MTRSKSLASEPESDFISSLRVILYRFYKVTFWTPPLGSRAHYRVVRSFPALHFDVTQMSVASRIERQQALSSAYRSWKKCIWIASIFVTDLVFMSVE